MSYRKINPIRREEKLKHDLLSYILDNPIVFWSHVKKEDSCWLWLGQIMSTGYGIVRLNYQTILTHRLSYILHKGDIPFGHFVHHKCHVRDCVNPSHLEAVTQRENNQHVNRRFPYIPKEKKPKWVSAKDVFYKSFAVDNVSGCWQWKKYIRPNGYAVICDGKKQVLIHRFSYELHKGKIPEGFEIDHLCRNRSCCNPEHLEAVSVRINCLRSNSIGAINGAKTACIHGHLFDEKNTRITPAGARACRRCHMEYERNRRKKLKQEGSSDVGNAD